MEVLRCSSSSSPPLMIKKTVPIKRSVNKVLMVKHSQSSVKKTHPSLLQIRSSSKKKIFEDQSKGIVCYRDGSGEITCEGYDEGPRLQQQLSAITYHPRDAEIIDLLQKKWLQIIEGGDHHHNYADKGGDDVQKGFNWNGFNSLL
ncbi:unnamed protein product [Camellia sinensis]|uniref:Uncharacterized protein n=1 Tax=Camellia sinensis var. sinensis TaxID=542762 RepID=A0A4S4CX45_CAMSN|nr:uncharacterized protein LOC114320704 [Camellia sinensis]THF94462.1 hypothetical protein TEA_020674 [Camellia sinensis var. sinensis]